jgi:hypothetical protein
MWDEDGGGELRATLPAPSANSSRTGTRWLTVAEGEEAEALPLPDQGTIRIGRDPRCEVVLRNPLASRQHAEIVADGARVTVRDLGSANGTRLGGARVEPGPAVPVPAGTALFVGTACLVVHELPAQGRGARRAFDAADAALRLEPAGAASVACVELRFAKRLSGEWVTRLVAHLLAERDLVVPDGAHGAWLLLPREDAGAARAAARAAARRLASWAFIFAREARLVEIGGARAWQADLERALSTAAAPDGAVVVRDEAMKRVFELVAKVAKGSISVLVLGETGAGKDVVASAIHARSPRAAAPLLRLDCATLSETLLESELFGHEAGSFTGAQKAKPGLLETASGGTVFLDEIGEMPLAVQAKLLHALESGEVMRLGGVVARSVDLRFVSATNRDLGDEVRSGRFRRDLYDRLSGVTVRVPPLRERRSEIEALARQFADHAAAQLGRPPFRFAPETVERLCAAPWPGNVRELRNAIERAALLAEDTVLDASLFD